MTGAFGIVGASGSGKTTLIERLIPHFSALGLRVATAKLTHHDLDLDRPGKDSRRHRDAGARIVALIGPNRTHIMQEGAPSLSHVLERLKPADIILVEGFIDAEIPKLEVHRPSLGKPLRALGKPLLQAVASDEPLSGLDVPVLPLNETQTIVDLIRRTVGR